MPSGTTKRPHPSSETHRSPKRTGAEQPRQARHHWWQRRTTHHS